MHTRILISLAAILLFSSSVAFAGAKAHEQTSVRERASFNEGWKFMRTGKMPDLSIQAEPANLEAVGTDDSDWETINLPHDYAVRGPFHRGESRWGNLPYEGVAWYRKSFKVTKADKGKRLFIDFDGAMSNAKVWLNGQYLGGRPYGYASFRLELTDHLKFGQKNIIAVRTENLYRPTRWYPGGGINRNVWLVKTAPVHVGHWGTQITTPEVTDKKASVSVKVTVDNQSGKAQTAEVATKIFEAAKGNKKAVAVSAPKKIKLSKSGSGKVELTATIKNPKRWDIATPNLYKAVTTVTVGGEVVDSYTTTFGVRTIDFTADGGFFLNGKATKMKGMCIHDDFGALGIEENETAIRYFLGKMKEMGANAIRTAHKPGSPIMLDLCDEMGFVVLEENFDEWRAGKKNSPNGYHKIFDEWAEIDTRDMIRRDRNHPSIVIWSSGNEMVELGKAEGDYMPGNEIGKWLLKIFKEEDPTRPLTNANNNYPGALKNKMWETLDVMGFNYKPEFYSEFHEMHPDIPILGTENIGTFSSRGEYFFPVTWETIVPTNWQVSSYANQWAPWGCIVDYEFEEQDKNPNVCGFFFWTGIDYRGEPGADPVLKNPKSHKFTTPELQAEYDAMADKTKIELHAGFNGVVDLCGFEKDMFYLFQAWCLPDKPMAHVLPHWNWSGREGEVTPVHVFTSGDEAEVFINGKSQGRKKRGKYDYRLVWEDTKYQPGELKVVAYKNGKKWAEDSRRTAGKPASIELTPHKTELTADGYDLSFVKVAILDKDGNLCPRASNMVKFKVSGAGKIQAVENGDSNCFEPIQGKQRSAFNGLCQVIVRTKKGESGPITVTATADGLTTAVAKLQAE
ncbi:MAG: beta-galactosidase GalB [Puniceicoccaceae bacterium]